jgi:uroporphyrinogen decarboxylase
VEALTPRERVLTAIARQRPDRIPCDFWAEPAALNRLFAYVGHHDEERLLDELGVDIRRLNAVEPPPHHLGNGVLQNMWGERYVLRTTPWGPVREDLPGALAQAATLDDIESFPWPTPDELDYSRLAAQCRACGDHAILYGFADVWQRPALVRGWEGLFLDMAERPEWAHRLCRRFAEFYVEDYTQAQEVCRGRIDLFLLISDLGSQRGPLVSIQMFRTFVAPYLKMMIDCIHSLGARVMYHSCGLVRPFIPDLIALGVDVLDPIQPVDETMSPERLKADFGDRLAFHGGLDTQTLLPFGTPEQVEAEACRYCETLGAGGGYILAPAHLFQPDVPPENVLAVYRANLTLS